MGLFNKRKTKKLQSTAEIVSNAVPEEVSERSSNIVPDSKFITIQLGTNTGIEPIYFRADGDIFSNEAVVSCLETNATYCGKIDLSAVRIENDGTRTHDWSAVERLLQLRPNPTMTAVAFWERVAYYYFKFNTSFIYIERNIFGSIIALWSIDPFMMKFKRISTGEIVFTFDINGTTVHASEADIAIIQRKVFSKAIFGDYSETPAILKIINLIDLNYNGVENAILTSATVRFLAEYPTRIDESKRKEELKELQDLYLSVSNKRNAIVFLPSDGQRKLTPVNGGQQKTANYMELNQWNGAVYKYFGCPEKVIARTATEEEMLAYYEGTPEVFFMAVSQELTHKLYTKSEIERGNLIIHSDKKLMYYSMKTRLEMFNAVREVGGVTLGTLMDLLGLDVAPGKRNVVVTSQNYIESLNGQSQNPKNNNDKDNKTNQDDKNGGGEDGQHNN